MRKDIGLRKKNEVELRESGKEIEKGLGMFSEEIKLKKMLKKGIKEMKVEEIWWRILKMRMGKKLGWKVGRLMMIGNREVKKIDENIIKEVKISIGEGEFGWDIGEEKRMRNGEEWMWKKRKVEKEEMKDIGDGKIFKKIKKIGRIIMERLDMD